MTNYRFLSEFGDRRTKKYKELRKKSDEIEAKYGANSKEMNDFFDKEYKEENQIK